MKNSIWLIVGIVIGLSASFLPSEPSKPVVDDEIAESYVNGYHAAMEQMESCWKN